MRAMVRVMMLCMLLFILFFSGCEEFGINPPDHITVNVMAAIYVKMVDENNNEMELSGDGIAVFIEMTKQNQERLVFHRIIQGGLCRVTSSYELSKGQWINCTATIRDGYMGYYPLSPAFVKLSWGTANASVNFRGIYNWYPDLVITMKKES